MAKKKKGKGGSKKGTPFERELSKRISMWWSGGERDDLVWHTHGSGGRATQRRKKGQNTAYQAGDLCPVDPEIQPLFDLVTWEVKRGYNSTSFLAMLDKQSHHKDQNIEGWWNKLSEECRASETPYGAIILRRDSRNEVIIISSALVRYLKLRSPQTPRLRFSLGIGSVLVAMRLEDFFIASPEKVKEIAKTQTSKGGSYDNRQ